MGSLEGTSPESGSAEGPKERIGSEWHRAKSSVLTVRFASSTGCTAVTCRAEGGDA